MDDGTEQKRSTAALFDEHAEAYLDSRVHRAGDDLDQLVDWVGAADRALDVATGAGHTAGALANDGASQVVATDAAPTMVATATRAFPSVIGVICDAERLPFATNSFDAVTCRIAAHHFPEPTDFVTEVARVLKPGGTLAFEDNVAPDDEVLDDFLNRVERIRDPTHVRSHRVGDWLRWFADAGLTVETSRVVTKTLDYDDWVANVDLSAERRERLEAAFADRPPETTEAFEIMDSEAGIESFANLKLLLRATR
ncbi:class I SAM-dependent methyltransferase [Halobacterium hubeiense]|uniref:class I SAM-dependent methyltransferase n=1 Tax=Halobacterium hubeiense TaxID=1407499 RepID=UPI003C770674